ncbi:Adhesion G-protein coupled receptor G4 [Trichoplax sp. H2]|nr:Adhesion G-protein coupled receptor G4 [Trichoplax sp. H2]|eukprot:RDD42448.1 Adhesion G-protein coupled receptor G4 [Trichoplax sp. H2]
MCLKLYLLLAIAISHLDLCIGKYCNDDDVKGCGYVLMQLYIINRPYLPSYRDEYHKSSVLFQSELQNSILEEFSSVGWNFTDVDIIEIGKDSMALLGDISDKSCCQEYKVLGLNSPAIYCDSATAPPVRKMASSTASCRNFIRTKVELYFQLLVSECNETINDIWKQVISKGYIGQLQLDIVDTTGLITWINYPTSFPTTLSTEMNIIATWSTNITAESVLYPLLLRSAEQFGNGFSLAGSLLIMFIIVICRKIIYSILPFDTIKVVIHLECYTIYCMVAIYLLFLFLFLGFDLHWNIRKLRKRKSNLIICLLSFSQLITNALILLDGRAKLSSTICRTIAILIHFFLMSKILWVAILALHFYLELIYTSINVFITAKLVLVGIAIPGVIVAICMTVNNINVYHLQSDGRCWMKESFSKDFFLYPMFGVIAATFIAFILIIMKIRCFNERRFIPISTARLFVLVGAVVILGLSWLFSNLTFMTISASRDIIQVIFVAFTSIQGLIMCYFYSITYF